MMPVWKAWAFLGIVGAYALMVGGCTLGFLALAFV